LRKEGRRATLALMLQGDGGSYKKVESSHGCQNCRKTPEGMICTNRADSGGSILLICEGKIQPYPKKRRAGLAPKSLDLELESSVTRDAHFLKKTKKRKQKRLAAKDHGKGGPRKP